MLRVGAYTGGRDVPSARFRVRQYIPTLRESGVEMQEFPALLGSYAPALRVARPLWAAGAVLERTAAALRSFQFDVTLLQREMISTLLSAEILTRAPRVLDVDDAIFLHRDGTFARALAGISRAVICGNSYLAERFHDWNGNVHILPTAVDTDRYLPAAPAPGRRSIGWAGTSSNFRYLEWLVPAFRRVLERHPDAVVRVMANRRPALDLPPHRLEFVQWSPENEVATLQQMTVGIMPLDDSEWARGKCSFKMLTYMACGIPVVASPVGMNADVLARGGGIGPRTVEEWIEALDMVLTEEPLARCLGRKGREVVLQNYSLRSIAPRLAAILTSCKGKE